MNKMNFKKVKLFYYIKGLTHIIVNLITGSSVFWNKTKIEKRKTKILFFNFSIKIENWKLSFFNFQFWIKLSYTKMSFSIPILKWKFNGTFGAWIKMKDIFEIHFFISNQKTNYEILDFIFCFSFWNGLYQSLFWKVGSKIEVKLL